MSAEVVPIDLGERSYEVHVGPGTLEQLSNIMPADAQRAAIITQANVVDTIEAHTGLDQLVIEVPNGEHAKSLSQVELICSQLAAAGFTRADVIVALGGGVVTDLAGFAAAVYHRGIRFVSAPTSLLAQVDAAIGGKTGVNLPEGKNLVGAFWQPHAVICDTDLLTTLPPRELRSGMGEMAKYHFIGEQILGTAGQLDTPNPSNLSPADLTQNVATAVRIKAAVVSADERDSDQRMILNYGHTLAHALETAGKYDLRHGEAVAIGLIYAAELAQRLERIDSERVAAHREVVAGYDLPTQIPVEYSDDELVALFARDKKAVTGTTFVLDSPDGVTPVTGIDEAILRDALGALR